MVDELNNMLYSWFKYVQGHEDWTDEQILYSLTKDDLNAFKNYLKDNFEEFFKGLNDLYFLED